MKSNVTDDGGGGSSSEWTDEKTTWASVKPVDASEFVSASLSRMNTSHVVKIRYYKEFDYSRRILYKGKVLIVKNFINKGDLNKFLIINATEE